eukprot:INCI17818.2.p2 GENE.INCI17818.2~~INCI17818.2.p2  ORF type:complete len:396 (+),score=65.00 INCI17818.2:144-1190(+)
MSRSADKSVGYTATLDSVLSAPSIKGHNFLSLEDFTKAEITGILDLAAYLKQHLRSPEDRVRNVNYNPLAKHSHAMIFEKLSTRTRISMETGMSLLGGHGLFLGSDDIHLGTNESIRDSAHVLGNFNDLISARVFSHDTCRDLAAFAGVPVINSLSDWHHPLQILADFQALREVYPERNGDLSGLKLAWVGDGNNVLHSLMVACPIFGMDMMFAHPEGYEPFKEVQTVADGLAAINDTKMEQSNNPVEAVTNADVIVTDTWISMGEEDQTREKMRIFDGYQVSTKLCSHAKPDYKFMHCLPRKPEEVTDDVFYSNHSIVWAEAENRMWTSMAVFLKLMGYEESVTQLK